MIVDRPSLQGALSRNEQPATRVPSDYEQDAVCLLMFNRGETMILAIQKADTEGYHWRDQIALPGGAIDATDRSATDAALRELKEELGIKRSTVQVLGSLGHFQTDSSKNDLEVIVAHWGQPSDVHPDGREIARVLELSLSDLVELHVKAGFRARPGSEIGDELVYSLADARIWGVTARILHGFLELALDKDIFVRRPT